MMIFRQSTDFYHRSACYAGRAW